MREWKQFIIPLYLFVQVEEFFPDVLENKEQPMVNGTTEHGQSEKMSQSSRARFQRGQ